MSESFFKAAVAKWLQAKGCDAVFVTKVDQEEETGGYCETCIYTSITVEIVYVDSDGHIGTYSYYGDMAEFVSDLDG